MVADNMLVWNVHGLNSVVHRNAVQDLVAVERISLVCLQETKLYVVTDFDVIQIIGSGFDYVFLPAMQMRGLSCLLGLARLGWSVAIVPVHTCSPPRFVRHRVVRSGS
jgi:exonuclease III